MNKIIEFDAPIQAVPGYPQNGTVNFPYDLLKTFGKKCVKVKITYDGVPYRGLLKSMGGDCVQCLIRKDIRQQINKQPGDLIHVTVQEDTGERVVEVPKDFQAFLDASPKAKEFFDKLAFTGKKEYVFWITSAKRAETRQSRLEKSIELLLAGKKEPK